MTQPAQPTFRNPANPRGLSPTSIQVRLFLTCWLVYALHFSPFVVRELYLAMNLAEHFSVRVDQYADLHSDLFEIPGRGAYLGGNPGIAVLAAVPYWLTLPIVNRVAPVRPPPPGEKVSADYKEQRTLRLRFYKKVRERGLDVRLGAAASITSVLFMAPLSALSAVVIFRLLGQLGFALNPSLWLSLLYAFGTPIFFRTATLSQNLLVALLGLFALALIWRPSGAPPGRPGRRLFFAGLLAGWALFTDYTGVITLAGLGLFLLVEQKRGRTFAEAIRACVPFAAGVLIPIALLLFYQWYCFGSPWWPAQFYMPKEIFRGYPSAHGFGRPLPEALWGLLFDPLYGLFVFAPLFGLAFAHFLLIRRGQNRVPGGLAAFAWLFSIALWIFCSCIHYTIRHQWHDGFRYLAPVIPFLFLLVADVLVRLPRGLVLLLSFGAVVEMWCFSMVREAPMECFTRIFLHGFELPWLTTLVKAAPQYVPMLEKGASPLPLFLVTGILIWGIWRVRDPWLPFGVESPD